MSRYLVNVVNSLGEAWVIHKIDGLKGRSNVVNQMREHSYTTRVVNDAINKIRLTIARNYGNMER